MRKLPEEVRKARIAARSRFYYELNIERNLEYHREYSKEYRKRNRERVSEYNSSYFADRPGIRSVYENIRRVRKAGNGGSHTLQQQIDKFNDLGNVCYYCGVPGEMTVDHMTPISRGGTDNIENIVPACKRCNCRKNNKTAVEFLSLLSTQEEIIQQQIAIYELKLA